MEVILFETVQNLGGVGDTVQVKSGYARNFLIPQGKAVPATPEARAAVEERRAELEKHEAQAKTAAQGRGEQLDGMVLEIMRKASDEGRLFGSVGTQDISAALAEQKGLEVKRTEIQLPEGAIRQVGEYDVIIRLHTEVQAQVRIHVVADT